MSTRPFTPALATIIAVQSLLTVARSDVFYSTDVTADTVSRLNQAGAQTVLVNAGLSAPQQVTYDAAGDLYVVDSGLGQVLKYAGNGAVPTQVGDTIAGLCSLAFDANGVLHVLSSTDDTVRKLTNGTFQILATLTGDNVGPRSLAFSPDGNIFVADATGNRILKVTPQGAQSEFSSEVIAPFGVAFDTNGKLHVTDAAKNGRIANFNPADKLKDVVTDLGSPRGLVFDRADVAYYLTATGELRKVSGANSTVLVASGLGDPQLLASRAPITRVVAFKGQPINVPGSATFASLGSPVLRGGSVAFKASLLPPNGGVSAANALGLWRSNADASLELLARRSFPIPNQTDLIVQTIGDPIMNDAGDVAFLGSFRAGVGGVTAANAGVVLSDLGGVPLRPLLRKGDSAPGAGLDPLVKFTAFKQLVLPNDAGPALLATVAGPGVNSSNNLGLWSADVNGAFSLVIRKGDFITAGGKSRKLAAMQLFSPTPMSLGQSRHFGLSQAFTFRGTFSDGFTAILRVQPGQAPAVIVEKTGEVGAAVAGARFASLASPAMRDDGLVTAFSSKLLPPFGGVTSSNALAMFANTGTNQLLARASFMAADVPGAFFATFKDPVMSGDGGLAFYGKLKPGFGGVLAGTAAGLWQDLGAGLQVVVRQGEVAPGVPKAAKFSAFKQFVLPNTGGAVFTAAITGSGITTANNVGLWADDGLGGVELLIRKGDDISIGGASRVVSKFTVFATRPGITGQTRHVDADGQVTCHITCTNGTQAVLTFDRP